MQHGGHLCHAGSIRLYQMESRESHSSVWRMVALWRSVVRNLGIKQNRRRLRAMENLREDILNVGGLSDRVFELISAFAGGELAPNHWVGRIEEVTL